MILGVVLTGVVGVIDHLTGPEVAFSIFYLIPISLVTWFVGKWSGFSISIASAVTWLAADLSAGHTYSHYIIPYWNSTVRLGFFFIVTFSLSALKRFLEQESELARKDYLTGVANGRYFTELASSEIDRARRYGRPFTVVYIDIDNFKSINDSFGHSMGDTLLASVGRTIRSGIRTTDIAARLGGDEFTILMPETDLESAQEFLGRLKNQFLDAMQRNGWPVTFSIGVVTFISPPITVDEMIRMADDLMYSAKKSCKGTIKYELFSK